MLRASSSKVERAFESWPEWLTDASDGSQWQKWSLGPRSYECWYTDARSFKLVRSQRWWGEWPHNNQPPGVLCQLPVKSVPARAPRYREWVRDHLGTRLMSCDESVTYGSTSAKPFHKPTFNGCHCARPGRNPRG